ncbi:unnamed protein product [Lymnaea stagnalis]|uniref:DUF4097 domain-containing protein n=1 Tax=Lymnaea stagnalis TaxID=6523 RepID=A0AAV2HG83_LYMST
MSYIASQFSMRCANILSSTCTLIRCCSFSPFLKRHMSSKKICSLKRTLFQKNFYNSQSAVYYEFPCYFQTSSTIKNKISNNGQAACTGDVSSLIETWFYEVCPHGSLNATLPFKTIVKPLDQPSINKVIIQLHFDSVTGNENDIPSGLHLSQISDLYNLDVAFEEDKAIMNISCDVTKGITLPIVCTLQVPHQFGLHLKILDDKDVSVERMESDTITVEAEKGNCYFNNIKCGSLSALCRSGNITCGSTLLGNTYFHTGKSGSITTEKLQGSSITCETEMGSMNVRSLYAENATFRSDAGNMHLGNCHGQLYLLAGNSNLAIESLEGDIDVGLQSGSVSVHLSKHQNANIEVETGDISVSFPEGSSTDLNLDCCAIMVDKNMNVHFHDTRLPHHKEGYIGKKGKASLNARTLSGTVHLKILDWIHTTNLAFKEDDS